MLVPTLAFSQPQPLPLKEPVVASLPSLAPLVDSVRGAVVNVDVQARRGTGPEESADDDQMERFFGLPEGKLSLFPR